MGQQNMLYTGPIEMEHDHLPLEPCLVPYGGITSFPQPNNNHNILQPSRNRTSFDSQHLPENHGPLPRPLPYAIPQYNGVEHHYATNNIDHNNVFLTPSPSGTVFPVPMNHGHNSQFMDGFNGAFKRKNAEGFIGNFQYFYPAPGSSSSGGVPLSTEGPMISESRGNNDTPLVMEAGVQRSVRNRPFGAIGVDPSLARNNSHLVHGNYGGPPLQALATPWLDQHFCGNGGDGGAFLWNHAPGIPYLQGCIGGGSTAFVHPPAIQPHQGPHNLHHPPPPMPPLHPQMPSTSHRIPTNNAPSYAGVNPFQNGIEPGPRFVGPTPPTGVRVHRPRRRDLMVESTTRHRSFPHLRVLPEDGVAILEISDYHELGHSSDHHRDMRLDIDHMSYEELLALGEQIGSVGSGLSEGFIRDHLKTDIFASSKSSSHPEDALPADRQLNFCVICQTNYNDQQKIGVLDCGHEYHVNCIKKWLIVKNTCPICKSTALSTTKRKD